MKIPNHRLNVFLSGIAGRVYQLQDRIQEKLRIESLNVRGLRDRTKRCDIFDRAKARHTDILFLQETHWTEADYTHLKDDWNIELIISGTSTAAKGTAILLNKTFEYKLHDTITDINGRYTIIDIEITLIAE